MTILVTASAFGARRLLFERPKKLRDFFVGFPSETNKIVATLYEIEASHQPYRAINSIIANRIGLV
jgi:hypothetical protein